MKKFSLLVMVLLLASGVSSAWAEKYHTVTKGESLSVIGKRYGVHWQDIKTASGLKLQSTVIHPGQRLLISEDAKGIKPTERRVVADLSTVKSSNPNWDNPGGNPFLGNLSTGLDVLKFKAENKDGLLDEVRNRKAILARAQHISKGGLIIDENGNKYQPIAMLSGGGKKPIEIKTGPDGVINNWSDKSHEEGGMLYTHGGEHLMVYFGCRNPEILRRIGREVSPPSTATINPPTEGGHPSFGFPHPDTPFPGVTPAQAQAKKRDNGDWQVGVGDYRSRVEGGDNNGKYDYTKGRARFLWFDPTEKISIGIGAFGFLAGGDGKADKYYTYDWNERVLGATAKILAEHKDFDIDLGAGKLYNHGKWKGEKVTHQVDDIFLASLHGNFYARRDRGEKWFPKFETNLEARVPFNTKVKQGDKTDNQTITLMLTQWIYDFDLNNDKSLVITPGFNFGGGVENSSKNRGFLQAGPATEFSSYSNVIAGTSFANFKFQGTGQWQPWSINLSINGTWKAIYASQIYEATAAELKGLPENGESKLLHNPADYL